MIGRVRQLPGVHARLRRRGFTLIELLVVIAIMAVLVSILMTTLSKVRQTATTVLCQTKLRSVSQRFTLFADSYYRAPTGPQDKFKPSWFSLDEFQRSLYGIGEYWEREPDEKIVESLERSRHPMMCPAGPTSLNRRAIRGLREGGLFPLENVSYGFNLRLAAAPFRVNGIWVAEEVALSPKVLDYPLIPLVLDVDAVEARKDSTMPFYTAPPLNGDSPLGSERWWFPSMRHAGRVQSAFVGGHVASSSDPLHEPGWDWRYTRAVLNRTKNTLPGE